MRLLVSGLGAGVMSLGLAILALQAVAGVGNFDTQMVSAMHHMQAQMTQAPIAVLDTGPITPGSPRVIQEVQQ